MVLAICQLIAVAVYFFVFLLFGLWAALGLVAALVAFNLYWFATRGEWFE